MTPSRTPSSSRDPDAAGLACAAALGARVAVGAAHACAIDDCGRVVCWGEDAGAGETTVPTAASCGILAIGAGLRREPNLSQKCQG
jgi:hypothetical protein